MSIIDESVIAAGVGVITPVTNDIKNLSLSCSDIKSLSRKTVEKIDSPDDMKAGELRRMSRLTRMALYASDRSFKVSGLNRSDGAVFVGLTHGTTSFLKEFHDYLFDFGPEMVSPNAFSNGVTNASLGAISKHLGMTLGGITLIGYENCGMEILHLGANSVIDNIYDICCAGAAEEYSPLVDNTYKRLRWFTGDNPDKLPYLNDTPGLKRKAFKLSEGSVFFTFVSQKRITEISHQKEYCYFYPVDDLNVFNEEIDLIISGAGGGPQDRCELEAIKQVLSFQEEPVGVLFTKCFFGETFAAGPLLSSAVAWDILVNQAEYPFFPVNDKLIDKSYEITDFSKIKTVLVIAGNRDNEISSGMFYKDKF